MVIIYNCILIVLILFKTVLNKINTKQKNKFFSIFSFCILTFVSSVRFQNVYSDFLTNYNHMKRIYEMSWMEVLSYDGEIGHIIFRKVCSYISTNPQIYFIVSSAIIVGCFIWFINKYSDDVPLSIILFYTIGGYFYSMNTTRQFIAISLCVLSIPLIINRNKFKFSILMLIACFIHTSSVVFIPLYFLYEVKYNKKIIIQYFLLGTFFIIFFPHIINFIQNYFSIYTNYDSDFYGSTGANILNIVLPILIFVIYIKNKYCNNVSVSVENNNAKDIESNLFLHMSTLYLISMLSASFNMLMMARLAHYFSICALYIPTVILKNKNKKMYLLIILFFSVSWFLVMNYFGKISPNPYHTIWDF